MDVVDESGSEQLAVTNTLHKLRVDRHAAWSKCPSSAPVPPQGAPGGSGQLGAPRAEACPLVAQPLPRVLELAASRAADFTAFDHSGHGVPIDTPEAVDWSHTLAPAFHQRK
eukprot:scaffold57351_cov50-Phaeocystis_antarctica.AAC.5